MTIVSFKRAWFQALIGAAFSFAFVELMLHGIELTPLWQVLPVVEREPGRPNPVTGYALRPNAEIINVRERRQRVTINSHGMRDRERQQNKRQSVIRIAVSGDSFTEALQVNQAETFTALAEESLNATQQSAAYEVLNFGISGAGPVQQLMHLRHSAKALGPDALILVLNPNDFRSTKMSDDSQHPAYVIDANGDVQIGNRFRTRRSQRYLETIWGQAFFTVMDHSRVARAIYLYIAHHGPTIDFFRNRGQSIRDVCATQENSISTHLEFWSRDPDDDAWIRVHQFFRDLRTLGDELNANIGIIFYGLGMLNAECDDALSMRREFGAIATRVLAPHDIAMVDVDLVVSQTLSPVMNINSLRGFGSSLGFGHLNQPGHRHYSIVVAEFITQWFVSNKEAVGAESRVAIPKP